MAETFGKRQRGQRKKERQQAKHQRKQERATTDQPEMSEGDIARDYFDGILPNGETVDEENTDGDRT